jgi:endonuclease/exonuclease/phosphatase (EEP) superfamily protein YafD
VIAGLAVLAVLVAAIATASSFSGNWRLALLAHFRPHLAITCAVLAVVVLAVDLPIGPMLALIVTMAGCAAVHWREVLRATPVAASGAGNERLRIAALNVLRSNDDHKSVIDWVRREKVDVFVAAEAVRGWMTALAALQDELPHVAGHPSGDVLIFSRHEMVGEPRHLFPNVGYAIAVEVAGITVVGVHTASPEDANHSRACDELIGQVSTFVREHSGPVVVVGDFNATPWSAPIVKLIAVTGLHFGPGARLGSFPAEWGGIKAPAWLGIPIDHVLAGHGARVAERRHGPRVGSDHWPVIAEIQYSRRLDPPDPRP